MLQMTPPTENTRIIKRGKSRNWRQYKHSNTGITKRGKHSTFCVQWLTITNLPWVFRTLLERAWYCWGLNYGDWTWLPRMTVHHPSPASRTSLKTPNYEAARPPCEDLCRQTERKEKNVPLRELILHMETVQNEWNFRLGGIFIHVCHEGKACSSSDSISNSISYSVSSNNCLLSRDFWFEWNILNILVPFMTGHNWKWTSQLK